MTDAAHGRPAVFLDRDGTINRERSFITDPDQLEILPGVPEALRELHAAGFTLAILTNQSGIARGLYAEEDLQRVHDELLASLPDVISRIDYCPHHPEGEVARFRMACDCRKPGPGMLLRSARELDADLARSFLVGDSARDVLMARATPARTVLVRCGKDPDVALAELERERCPPDHVAEDLRDAARWICSR